MEERPQMHFIERLLDTIQDGNSFFCGNIPTDRSENRLVAQHHRTVLYICVINILPVIISGGKIAHDEIFPFCRTHVGKWGGFEEILFINSDLHTITDCSMLKFSLWYSTRKIYTIKFAPLWLKGGIDSN